MRSHLLLFALLSGTIVSVLSLGLENNINHNNLQFTQIAYGHNFTPNESASFLAFIEQLQTEWELVQTNLANNNISLAQQHANNAAVLLTPNITREIAEQNQRVADDLTMVINDLQDVTSSSSQQQQQSIDQVVSNIDAILGEAVTTRIEQEQRDNATIQALAFADLIDSILANYGNAYAVDFDMTNMSNMAMTGSNNDSTMAMDNMIASEGNNNNNSNSMSMESIDNSATTMNEGGAGEMNRNYSLVNMSNYQSAQALSTKALEAYNTELKPIISGSATAFATNLENALTQLNDAIRNKASPMDIMMIVHMQVHPNLLQTFGLGLQ
jgi:ElaB/YqjD/DUF883 family membrane-anchored ribosome-binding protein